LELASFRVLHETVVPRSSNHGVPWCVCGDN